MIFRVGNVCIDTSTRQVHEGPSVLPVEPRIFDFLVFLIAHRDRVVSKAELLQEVWGGQQLVDSVVTRAASMARRITGPSSVRSVYGRGYQFTAPAEEASPTSSRAARTDAADRPSVSSADPSFVGRETELSELAAHLGSAAEGTGTLFLLSGDAGIGKTRILGMAALKAAGLGFDVAWGRCPEAEDAPPLWPWTQVLAALCIEREVTTSALIPGDASNQLRLFEDISRRLVAAARRTRICILLDDWHRADASSLRLLEYLSAATAPEPIAFFVAYRHYETGLSASMSRTFARLARQPGASLRELPGLTPSDIQRYLVSRVPAEELEAVAATLHDATAGNPFLLTCIVPPPGTTSTGFVLPRIEDLPREVRGAILQQLDCVSGECRSLLAIACIAGRTFDVRAAAEVAGLSTTEALRLMDEAERARLVRTVEGTPAERTFVHVLVQSVLYEDVPRADRAAWHHSWACVVERAFPHRRQEHLALLAHHFCEGAAVDDGARALELCVEAGRGALQELAYEEAAAYFARATTILDGASHPNIEVLASILLDLGASQMRAGDRDAARTTFDRAVRVCRVCDGTEWLGKAALALAPGPLTLDFGGYDQDVVHLLEEALALTGSSDRANALRGLLLAKLATISYWGTPLAYRLQLTSEASALVATEDASVRARVAATCLIATWTPDNLQDRAAVAPSVLRLAVEAGEHEMALLTRLLIGSIHLELGDIRGARRECAAFREANETHRLPQCAWISLAIQATFSFLDARLEDVETLSLECYGIGMRLHDQTALQTFGALLMFVRFEQDRSEEFIPKLQELRTSFPRVRAWESNLALALARSGRVHEANSLLSSLADADFPFARDIVWLAAVAFAAEVAAILRHPSTERLYTMLAPFRDRTIVPGLGAACLGSANRYLGLLARADGRGALARRHFEEALTANEALGSTLLVARSQCDLATALCEEADPTARERAASLAAAARSTAERHGLHQLLGALDSLVPASAVAQA